MHSLLVAYLQVFSIYIVCAHISAKYGIMEWRNKLLDQNKVKGYQERPARENDYIAFDEYYNEPIGRSFGNCEIPFVTS